MIKKNFSFVLKVIFCVLFVSIIVMGSLKAVAGESSSATDQKSVDKTGWQPIDVNLPSAMFVGTPQDITVDHVEM